MSMNKGFPSLSPFLYFLFVFHPVLFFLSSIFHLKCSQLTGLFTQLKEKNYQFSTIEWDTQKQN